MIPDKQSNPFWLHQVTFLLTEDPSHKMKGSGRKRRRRRRETLSPDRFALYSSLSSVSGGLTVFTTNSDIHSVSAIVEDNTAADKVLQQGKMLTVVEYNHYLQRCTCPY